MAVLVSGRHAQAGPVVHHVPGLNWGLRYRVQVKVPGNRRRTIDIAFTRVRLAVYVDGCFWHGCPEHHKRPATNTDWWDWKIRRNQDRDRDTDAELARAGWAVLRFWEHKDSRKQADVVEALWRARRRELE